VRVQELMRRDPVTVGADTSLRAALGLLQSRGVRHLPVLDGDTLVGIVSDRDFERVQAVGADLDARPVADIVTRTVITVAPMFPVEEAARLMTSERGGAVPVTDAGRLVRIVTETDVLELLVRTLGADEPSTRLEVAPAGDTGLGEIVRLVEDAGAALSSVVTPPASHRRREVVLRVRTIDPRPAVRALEGRGHAVRQGWRGV
jgi:acetoin utilization protein AcuB